ncbi:CPBP family intramembrane metalloprotease [Paenibacillus sp. N1-5-1-14]|uniref:CPBP family intramembrane glutamic endopeptidase n=1 Tax=Paenibacillus radicibacter TaxID=2972488 RepID=UPI002158DDC1|nr:CPBP family intramembrane glutamic endopeptidase [Paenibacillus radicibacter]MCR8646029.1 CPBP family intramembrane metalloprotease [Paenibacillus radicibacter]
MIKQLTSKQQSFVFIGLVLLLGLGFSLISNISTFVYMLIPTLATLLMMFIVTRDGYNKTGWQKLGLNKLGMHKWLFAIFVPIIPLALGYGIVWISGLSVLVMPDTILGFRWAAFPIAIIAIFISNVLTNSLGEELGWRGYLFPQLHTSFGFIRGSLMTGFIHGIWHFPMIIFTTSYHDEGNVWINLFLMLISTMSLAPVIGYVRVKSESVWPSSILHTSHNVFWAVFAALSQSKSSITEYISGDTSIVVILFYAILSLWVFKAMRRNQEKKISS